MNINELTSINTNLCKFCFIVNYFNPALPYFDLYMIDVSCDDKGSMIQNLFNITIINV